MPDYVIVEYNQASHMPKLATRDVFDLEEATTEAEYLREETQEIGRQETYRVALLEYVEEAPDA